MQTKKWVLDAAHSELTFKVRHMMISNVKGEFNNFSVDVSENEAGKLKVKVTIDATSIHTNNTDRDNHLRSADFFNADENKEIVFESEPFTAEEEDFDLKGNLSMNGITKEITVEVESGGQGMDPWGNKKTGYSAEGKINRKDWGINWNTALEAGGVLVSEDVKFNAEIQLMEAPADSI